MREPGVLCPALPADRGRCRTGGRRHPGGIRAREFGQGDHPQAARADRRHLQRCRRDFGARADKSKIMTEALPAQVCLAQVYLALGGNVGNSRAILDRAVALLCDGLEVRLTARSADYLTPPWGFKY